MWSARPNLKSRLNDIPVGIDIYRVFCFFDEGNLVILLNGFQKKTDKTPKNEIDKAERLKKKYYEDKSRK